MLINYNLKLHALLKTTGLHVTILENKVQSVIYRLTITPGSLTDNIPGTWVTQDNFKVALNHRYLKIIVFEIFTLCNHQILIFITVLVTNSSAKWFLNKIDFFPKLSGMNAYRDGSVHQLIDS